MLQTILLNTPQISRCTATYHPSRKLSKLDKPDTLSCGPLHMDKQRQRDQLEPIFNSSVPIQDVALKIFRERWAIEMSG